ncbi:IucA/IucC family protein [Actinomadura rudentiformis]|uniref:IucA/IucC family protein n=1 Tax=Actinomadura rudentiformis TaxID=359158 RepID=A0A6H9YSY0_9ACTN|nr:IucA/IucC family protein [Actinomadura rudentiformis]KAB2343428.1 IucA/IucC family protein [Actinomadura rudentiformis]
MLLTGRPLGAGDASATALLNCLIREVCAPEHQVWPDGAHLLVRLPRVGVMLRAGLSRPPSGPTFRIAPPYEERRGNEWIPAGWDRLADLIAGELELATGRANPEFLGQVTDGHAALEAILSSRSLAPRTEAPGAVDRYVESEQSLVTGHRFHPSPKARQGSPADWLPYAPETRSRFQPRWLAVREDVLVEEGDPMAFAHLESFGPAVPDGFRLLPVHPWELHLLADRPILRRAFAQGLIHDLGADRLGTEGGIEAVPTSSVRTAYVPAADTFCKFSLDIRITNCVRKNAWYELTGAVVLDRLVRRVFDGIDATFLAEPAYRSVALADRRLYEGLGVILRQGVQGLPGTPLLTAALADPYGSLLASLPALATPDGAMAWWKAYVRQVAPPVLHACLEHGIVLEPHLQNVLVCVDDDGMPVHAAFRDLEGTKLVGGRWDHLTGLPSRVREAMTYDADRAWNRVVYCLLVNHLTETAAAVADLHPALDARLWPAARRYFAGYERHPEVRALLAGVPLPAKANLRARWARTADRAATYVPVPNPLAPPAPQLN